jgi:dihydroorotate dehydrogenase (fumarate)
MADLRTTYMGLNLRNPIIASSSGLTGTVKGVKAVASAGAGAIVLKSLFEEQIEADVEGAHTDDDMSMHPEAYEYVQQMGKHMGPEAYLDLIAEAKKATDVPIIASLNCVTTKWWGNYAKQIEEAGADGVELNISVMPRGSEDDARSVEERFIRIVDKVRQNVSLPISTKIGPYFTALPAFTMNLRKAGVRALTLFNRFYQLDIDIDDLKLAPGYQFSDTHEVYPTLRWISILYGNVGCELSASTGVHRGPDAAKLLLAGAQSVQVCSTLYKNGVSQIGVITQFLERWMDEKGFKKVDDIRGRLSQSSSTDPEAYERLQYIKALTGLS